VTKDQALAALEAVHATVHDLYDGKTDKGQVELAPRLAQFEAHCDTLVMTVSHFFDEAEKA